MDVKEILEREMILASASPRRKQLMQQAGFQFEVIIADIDESFPPEMAVHQIPQYIAEMKAKAVAEKVNTEKIIIAADTIVACKDKVLGKPTDLEDAKNMLQFLSGEQHTVITGVCLKQQDKQKLFQQTKINKIEGCYFNVVGLPVADLYKELSTF